MERAHERDRSAVYRDAGFTAVAILALALGIGVNTAVFTCYKAVVSRSLDARDPGRMVNLALVLHSGDFDPGFIYPDYEAYRDQLHSFSGVIAQSMDRLTLSDTSGVRTWSGASARSLSGRLGLLPTSSSAAELANTFNGECWEWLGWRSHIGDGYFDSAQSLCQSFYHGSSEHLRALAGAAK